MDLAETIELDLIKLLKETSLAYQVQLTNGIYWIPKSCCRIVNKKIYIMKWFADKNGIDYLSCDVVSNN